MFGRFKENEDEPGWKEKLAEWRDSPPVILQRPAWLGESPASLAWLFGGIALLLISVVYFIVPADALPAEIPGRWIAPTTTVPKSTTSSSTTTTTTTPPAVLRARLKAWSQDSEEE